jgi:hypothetical protein
MSAPAMRTAVDVRARCKDECVKRAQCSAVQTAMCACNAVRAWRLYVWRQGERTSRALIGRISLLPCRQEKRGGSPDRQRETQVLLSHSLTSRASRHTARLDKQRLALGGRHTQLVVGTGLANERGVARAIGRVDRFHKLRRVLRGVLRLRADGRPPQASGGACARWCVAVQRP